MSRTLNGPRLCNVIELRKSTDIVPDRAAIDADIRRIEEQYGPNLYTHYLRKKGSRPDKQQAATIGKLLGARVKDRDGKLQPPLDNAARNARRMKRSFSARERDLEDQLRRLHLAISELAKNADAEPAELIGRCCPQLDAPEIVASLRIALKWLTRFDEEWHRREECQAV